jgi:hypothetical protein
MATLVMNTTSNLGKIVSRGLITFAMGVWAFGESAGRARAAEALWREGFHEEAKRLMLENK